MRYTRILLTLMALLPGLLSFATTHRGTAQLKDWQPQRGANGPAIESITLKWAFTDRSGRPEQTFFMQWYLGRDYFYEGQRYAIANLGREADRISFSSLVLEADLYADDRKVSTLRFDMGATPPHGGTWGPEVAYEWSLRKLFPNLSQSEAEREFSDAYLELKNLRIRDAWFGGERQLAATLGTPKSTSNVGDLPPSRNENREERYREPERDYANDRYQDREPARDGGNDRWARTEPEPSYERPGAETVSRYEALIALGDSALGRYEYNKAQGYYDQAVDLIPGRQEALAKRQELQEILTQRDSYTTLVEVLRDGYAEELLYAEREQEAALKMALSAVSEDAEACAFKRYNWLECQVQALVDRQGKAALEARMRVYEPEKAPGKDLGCGEAPCELQDDARSNNRFDYAVLARRKYKLYQESDEEAFLAKSKELLTQAKEQDAKNPEVWLTSALLEEDPLEALAALNQALALDEDLIEAQALQKDLENALLEQIFNQVNAGETVLLKKALSKGLVNAETSFQGQSLMAQAIEKEQIGLMSELLVATSTSRSADGGPAQPWLFEAARQNKTKAAALLINKGARADLPREDGQTPLSVAASAGAKQVMTLFLKDATEDLDASEALLIAVQEDDFVMAKAILQSKAKADPRDEEGNNLLMMGLMDENQDLVNLLLDNRFPLNQQNNSGETALSLVAKAQNNDLTQQFLKMGAEPEPALQALDQEDAEWLAGELFAYALDNDNNDWISLSLNYDPNIPLKQHSSGKSYLSYALAAEKWGLCAALLSNGQLPLDAEIDGENFLFKAVEAEAVPVVQALAEQEAIDLNQTNEQGLTSLHLAVDKGNLDLVQVLVQGGHDLEPTDSRDNTPLHRSLILGQVEIAEYLSSEEHLYEVKNNRSQHPIHLAVRESQLGVVRNLLANDTDVNLLGESGMTPLHYAAEERNYEMAQFLVEQGADLSIRDDFGRAPRKIARDNNDKNLYELVKGDLRDRIPEINMPEIKKPKVKLPKVFRRNN